eukprot:6595238-Pyramimonas_sp.AAC.1
MLHKVARSPPCILSFQSAPIGARRSQSARSSRGRQLSPGRTIASGSGLPGSAAFEDGHGAPEPGSPDPGSAFRLQQSRQGRPQSAKGRSQDHVTKALRNLRSRPGPGHYDTVRATK